MLPVDIVEKLKEEKAPQTLTTNNLVHAYIYNKLISNINLIALNKKIRIKDLVETSKTEILNNL